MVQQFPITPTSDSTITWAPSHIPYPNYALEEKIKLMDCLQRIIERSDNQEEIKDAARIKLLEQIKSIV